MMVKARRAGRQAMKEQNGCQDCAFWEVPQDSTPCRECRRLMWAFCSWTPQGCLKIFSENRGAS